MLHRVKGFARTTLMGVLFVMITVATAQAATGYGVSNVFTIDNREDSEGRTFTGTGNIQEVGQLNFTGTLVGTPGADYSGDYDTDLPGFVGYITIDQSGAQADVWLGNDGPYAATVDGNVMNVTFDDDKNVGWMRFEFDGDIEHSPPSADFSADPTSGDAPLTVGFTDASEGEVESWEWDFGDGGSSTEQNPEHTYLQPGSYSVSLTVSGPGGSNSMSMEDYIDVSTGDIQRMIDAVVADPAENTVVIGPGSYVLDEPIVIEGDDAEGLTLIAGDGRDETTIDADGADVAIIARAQGVTVEGFTIQHFTQTGIEITGDGVHVSDNIIWGGTDDMSDPEAAGVLIDGAAGTRISDNRIEDLDAGIHVRGAASDTLIANNTITQNDVGLENLQDGNRWPTDTRAVNNNIEGNGYGAAWTADEGDGSVEDKTLGAALNWWGDASGPYQVPFNERGAGNELLGEVDFDPWLTSESTGRGLGVVAREPGRTENPREGLAVEMSHGGEVYVSGGVDDERTRSLPGDVHAPSFSELFIVDYPRDDASATITLEISYDEMPSEQNVYWFDKANDSWETVQDPDPVWHDDYVSVTIGHDTTPSFDNFSGVAFAVPGVEDDDDDDDDDSSSSSSSSCFIATAAYGTPMAAEVDALRALRDQKLLSSDAGRRAVDAYYRVSPPVADMIGRSETVRAAVRLGLEPVVSFSRSLTSCTDEQ